MITLSAPHDSRAQSLGSFQSTLDTNRGRFRTRLISDQVYDLLRQAIVEGELAAGNRVVESDVARRLGVSQAPVREAVRRLAHEGLLTHLPRRGNFVAEVSEHDAEQARQVREPLERLAAQLAVARVDDDSLAELDSLVAQMRDAVAAGDVADFRDLDISFHGRVCQLAGNPFLTRIWEVMEPSLRTLRAIADPLFEGDWVAIVNEHGRLVDLLRAGDPDKAAAAFADHAAGRAPVPDRRRSRARRTAR